MTIAAALGALLAVGPPQEPPPSPPETRPMETEATVLEPPTSEPPLAPPPPGPASPGPDDLVVPPPDLPQAAAVPPPPAPPRASPGPAEAPPAPAAGAWSAAAGPGATRLMGVDASGVALRLAVAPGAAASHVPPAAQPAIELGVFLGETGPGLAMRSISLTTSIWTRGRRLRAGAGLHTGVVAYRRATTGEWPMLLSVGLSGGVELTLLPLGPGALVVGAHGTASLESWFSGALAIGFRGERQSR